MTCGCGSPPGMQWSGEWARLRHPLALSWASSRSDAQWGAVGHLMKMSWVPIRRLRDQVDGDCRFLRTSDNDDRYVFGGVRCERADGALNSNRGSGEMTSCNVAFEIIIQSVGRSVGRQAGRKIGQSVDDVGRSGGQSIGQCQCYRIKINEIRVRISAE